LLTYRGEDSCGSLFDLNFDLIFDLSSGGRNDWLDGRTKDHLKDGCLKVRVDVAGGKLEWTDFLIPAGVSLRSVLAGDELNADRHLPDTAIDIASDTAEVLTLQDSLGGDSLQAGQSARGDCMDGDEVE
jgi:hypothetical protein